MVCSPAPAFLGHAHCVPGQRGLGLGLVLLPSLGQQAGGVAAQRLQHCVPHPAIRAGPRRDQQRALHQAQHHRGRRPVPASQQRQPPIQPVQQLRHAQRLHPRRCQLDRQRHPVQPDHQPRHVTTVLTGKRETRIYCAGPVAEQPDRLRPGRATGIIRTGHRQRQRRQPVRLPRDPQRLPARRQNPHIITRLQQPAAQRGGRADHMLAVIQHQQQQLLAGQHPRHRLGHRDTRLLPHPQRHRHHRRDLRPVLHRRQLRQPFPRRRTGPPPARPPRRPAGSCRPRPARSPSPAGTPAAAPPPRAPTRPGR